MIDIKSVETCSDSSTDATVADHPSRRLVGQEGGLPVGGLPPVLLEKTSHTCFHRTLDQAR